MSYPNANEAKVVSRITIPFNYAMIISGCLLFPITVFSAVVAWKKMANSSGWQISHWRFQLYTSALSLLSLSIFSIVVVIMFFFIPGEGIDQVIRKGLIIKSVSCVIYIIYIWIITRAVRGIYLAGLKQGILNPETFWLWPKSQPVDPI